MIESVQHSNIAEEEMGQLHSLHFAMNAEAAIRARVYTGRSESICCACAGPIPIARQQALPGVKMCVQCAAQQEHRGKVNAKLQHR